MTTKTPKKIGLWSCVAFAVGAMVGAGVFVLSGVAVHDAGPGAIVAFALAGFGVLCSATSSMVIASLADAGELGYAPVGSILGHRFWGFVTSWAFYLSATICTAFVLNAFGLYMHDFFTHTISPLTWSLVGIAAMTLLNLGDTSEIGRIEGLLVSAKVAILLLLIGFGLAHLHSNQLVPFMPHGSSTLLTTSGILFIAYLGFNTITNIAGDVAEPRKTVPKAILISVLLVMAIYVGVVAALLAFPLSHYDEASVGTVAKHLIGPVGGILVPIAALISTLSAANSNILGSSEIMVRLAARKDVPTIIGKMWRGHPVVSVLFGATLCTVLLLSQRTTLVISLANVAALTGIGLINLAAILVSNRRQAEVLRLPGGAVLPFLGLASCVGELFLLGVSALAWGYVLIAAGASLYLSRKYFHNPAYHRLLVAELEKHGGPALRSLRKLEKGFRSKRTV